MGSFRVFSQRTGRMATLAALVVATLGQALLPALASADGVTSRSIALSSATKSATSTYKVTFTTDHDAGAFVIEFCANSPVVGQTCTAPTGMNAAGVTTSTSGASISTTLTAAANKFAVVDTITHGTPVVVDLANIVNPSVTGAFYARIATYTADTDTTNYSSASLGANNQDSGSVAMNISDEVNVSGVVQESMLFCVSGETLTDNCIGSGASAPALTAPSVKLGNATGALDSADVYQGTIYTQISTNAVGGAIVSLKSDAAQCGGLLRVGDTISTANCHIPAAGTSGTLAANTPGFGVKTGTDVATANGKYQASANYSSSAFHMDFDSTNPTAPTHGVTSTYGDEILNTDGGVANSLNMPLTFGAAVSNNTPAGTYQAKLSLIATGTF